MNKKKIIIGAVMIVILWLGLGLTDFLRVKSFEKPLFCVPVQTYDDGGSGHYVGLGYAFDITGNFLPEEELPGVTEYVYYILGFEMKSGIRD